MKSNKVRLFFVIIILLLINCFIVIVEIPAQTIEINGSVKYGTTYQELLGFGGAIAYDAPKLMAHTQRDIVTNLLFSKLGIDIIRIRNTYKWDKNTMKSSVDLYKIAKTKNPDFKSLLVAWSPAPSVKSNNTIKGGTIKQNKAGIFLYKQYGDWWKKSLLDIKKQGIIIDYISIQNEPDIETSYDSCRLKPVEDGITAGYDKALEAVFKAVTKNKPLFLGPETMGLNSSINYIDALTDKSMLYGYSHHLYNDGDYDTPKGFTYRMNFYKKYVKGTKPIFMTEYAKTGEPDYDAAVNMAWHIHNTMTIEGSNSYIAWSLFRRDTPGGFITLDSDSTYIIRDLYYTMKHFSFFTDPGWKRVEASCENTDIKMTAFKDPSGKKLNVIITNVSDKDYNLNLSLDDFKPANSSIFQTTSLTKWQNLGSLKDSIPLHAKSNTTLTMNN